MKTIYKKDTKWKIRIIEVFTKWNILVQRSWIIDWKLVENKKECKPKNIWKINATNAIEQAILEMESFIKDKLTKWYFESIEELEQNQVILPMLAKDYKKESHKIKWWVDSVYVQPKLDWMRCLIIKQGNNIELISRAWKKIEHMYHIKKRIITSWIWFYIRLRIIFTLS